MTEKQLKQSINALHESGARYVVDTRGQPLAVLLTLEEYEHYLDLLEDEADSQDEELAERLLRAGEGVGEERMAFRDYLLERTERIGNEEISG